MSLRRGDGGVGAPRRWPAWIALVVLAAVAARAEEPASDVAVGIAGRYRAGSWTPLVVSGPRAGDDVRVAVEDPDGCFVAAPRGSGADAGRKVRVRFGRPQGRVRIENATTGTTSLIDLPTPLPATGEVWLLVGDLPALGRAARLMSRGDGNRPTVIAGEPPDDADGGSAAASDYDGIDTIIACGRSVAGLEARGLTGIDAWIRGGGRLVLAAGASAAELAATGGTAASWLPGPVAELVPLRRVAALEAYARASGLAERLATAEPRVPLLANRGSLVGAVDVFEGNSAAELPLVVRRAHGLGSITWLGLDLDVEPCRGWAGCDTLLVRLLGGRIADTEGLRPAAGSGPPDLAGQLRLALEAPDERGGIAPVPFPLIAGAGLLYVACIFPLEWWLVSRGGRPGLAWLSLAVLVAGFTTAAWALSGRGWRGAERAVAMRSAEVVDVDAGGGGVRGHGWLAVWRRENGEVDVSLGDVGQGGAAAISWFADAGPGFGAIDAAVPHRTLAASDYGYGPTLAGLLGVPVAALSSRLFEASWSAAAVDTVTSSLVRDGQGTLRGGVAHHLPFTLEDCRLAHGGWVYDVGDLAPGQRHDLATGRGPRSLAGALTRRGAIKEREAAVRWDRSGTDLSRILEVAGFHAAAGGTGYTGLEPGRLARLDLSPLLPLDRAVLFGTAADAPSGWTTPWLVADRAGDVAPPPPAARLYRIVIPLGAPPPARAAGADAE